MAEHGPDCHVFSSDNNKKNHNICAICGVKICAALSPEKDGLQVACSRTAGHFGSHGNLWDPPRMWVNLAGLEFEPKSGIQKNV